MLRARPRVLTAAMLNDMERSRQLGVAAFDNGAWQSRADHVVCEEPLEMRLGGEALAVVMRTPGDDLELTAGFLLAEGIVTDADDIDLLRHCEDGTDPNFENVVDAKLSAARAQSASALLATRNAERSTVTSASCGVCGKRSIESLHQDAAPFEEEAIIDVQAILRLPERLRAAQNVFSDTGGLHAAAVFDANYKLLVVREDVGRHNAVDKCIGHLLLREQLGAPGMLLMVSGRSSFEIVQKALMARVQTIAAVSAPSTLAVDLAKDSNMGLVGFVRDGRANVYSGTVP